MDRNRSTGGRPRPRILGLSGLFTSIALLVLGASSAAADTALGVGQIRFVAGGGTSTEKCDSLRGVLSSISDSSTQNRYLVQLAPGFYYCGSAPVVLAEGIALVGTGIQHTFIRGTVDNTVLGVLHLNGSQTQVRSLTVHNLEGSPSFNSIGISVHKALTTDRIDAIVIESVEILAQTYGVMARSADLDFRLSQTSPPILYDDPGSGNVTGTFQYSSVGGIQGTGNVRCFFTHINGVALNKDCVVPP